MDRVLSQMTTKKQSVTNLAVPTDGGVESLCTIAGLDMPVFTKITDVVLGTRVMDVVINTFHADVEHVECR